MSVDIVDWFAGVGAAVERWVESAERRSEAREGIDLQSWEKDLKSAGQRSWNVVEGCECCCAKLRDLGI